MVGFLMEKLVCLKTMKSPMVSSDKSQQLQRQAVGIVEEFVCDVKTLGNLGRFRIFHFSCFFSILFFFLFFLLFFFQTLKTEK